MFYCYVFRACGSEYATGEPVSWGSWYPLVTKLGADPIMDACFRWQQILVTGYQNQSRTQSNDISCLLIINNCA